MKLGAALAVFALAAVLSSARAQDRAAAPGLTAPPAPVVSDEVRLDRLFADDARREERLNPLEQLYRGELPDTREFSRLFTDALDRSALASAQASLSELGRIDRARLSPGRQLSYDVFARNKREDIAWLQPDIRALTAVRPLNHFGGLHVEYPTLMAHGGAVDYNSEADYRRAP
jgi:uncharacterized protein (DUF885 family)